jgi:hypothetical protein
MKIPDDLLHTVFGEIQNLDILFARPDFVSFQPQFAGNKVIWSFF